MSTRRNKNQGVVHSIKQIEKDGIQKPPFELKKNMVMQFSEPYTFIREFVVNAYDAGSSYCFITGREDNDSINIIVEDAGCGMDRCQIVEFNTLFCSSKESNRESIGCHGVGKLSAAAVPGQTGFNLQTSTGKECWQMTAGNLLDNTPIELNRVEPVPSQGTRIEITFKKQEPLNKTLNRLKFLLEKYLKYLPIDIVIFGKNIPEQKNTWPYHVKGNWVEPSNFLVKEYQVNLAGHEFDIVLELNQSIHELYNNRVLVSKSAYNLFSHGSKTYSDRPANLSIKVESPDFTLPFGRHRLMGESESALVALSKHLRSVIIPDYFNYLNDFYQTEVMDLDSTNLRRFEEMAVSLMKYDPSPNRPWCRMPIFNTRNHKTRLSLNALKEKVSFTGIIYLENEKCTGTDYSVFEAPVLAFRQTDGGLWLLKRIFAKELKVLTSDFVMEAPAGLAIPLGKKELNYQATLSFQPETLKKIQTSKSRIFRRKSSSILNSIQLKSLGRESRLAKSEMAAITFRVNYLVGPDGTTPSLSQKCMFKSKNQVIFNLHHREIQGLMTLSYLYPDLAGHFTVSMTLTDDDGVLPHLTPEAREQLVQVDAASRFSNYQTERTYSGEKDQASFISELRDLKRKMISYE